MKSLESLQGVAVFVLDCQNFAVVLFGGFDVLRALAESAEPVVDFEEKFFLLVNVDLWSGFFELSFRQRVLLFLNKASTEKREAFCFYPRITTGLLEQRN